MDDQRIDAITNPFARLLGFKDSPKTTFFTARLFKKFNSLTIFILTSFVGFIF